MSGFLFSSDSVGTRTQDPYIKSVLLYQLSYEIIPYVLSERDAKIGISFSLQNVFVNFFKKIC